MICNLISKVVAPACPTLKAEELAQFLKRRKFIGQEILNREGDIDLSIDELLGMIEKLMKIEDRAEVIKILSHDKNCWVDEVDFAVKMLGGVAPKLLQEETLFNEAATKDGLKSEYEEMKEVANDLYKQIDKFLVNYFQCYAATKIVAADKKTTVASIPTGSGKTYIAALLAKHYISKGLKVAIVTSEEFLVKQMSRMLGQFRFDVDILTMKSALCHYEKYDVMILDEADECVLEHGSTIHPEKMRIIGFWDLMEKKTILLTATLGHDLSDVLKSFFGETRDSLIKFDSLIK